MIRNQEKRFLPQPADATRPTSEWAEALEQVMQQDREVLQKCLTQDYFLRPITPAEIQEAKATGRHLPEDALMLVGEIAPGCRTRLAFTPDEMPPIAEFKALQQQTRQQLGITVNPQKVLIQNSNLARPKPKGFGKAMNL
jgi:hypothetical protein